MHLAVRELREGGHHLAGMLSMFGGMDSEKRGMLSASEISSALQQSGGGGGDVAPDEIDALIKAMDGQGTGFLVQARK